jgi:hypothetical protein
MCGLLLLKQERKRFFFEKKKQKPLITAGCGALVPTPAGPKVFCFFFSKKKRLPYFLCT